jgi:GTPase SAR1 family protein
MKIGLCGTMSVGKTTLVNALKELPEFKDYMFRTERSKYLMSQGIPLNTDSTLKGQTVFLAERAMELMQENIITDRTIIDVMAFARASKSMDHSEKYDFEQLATLLIKEYDYIFYVSPKGVDMEDNGVRETDIEYRNLIDSTITNFIKSKGLLIKNYGILEGPTEQRIEQMKFQLGL